jgi:small conductance mechanosensitive channel
MTAGGARLSTIEVGVAYGTDLRTAKSLLATAVDECDEAHTEPPPEALILEFGENAIILGVRFWYDPTILEQLRAVDAVSPAISESLVREGIVIALPQRTLWWGGGPAVPPSEDAGNGGS